MNPRTFLVAMSCALVTLALGARPAPAAAPTAPPSPLAQSVPSLTATGAVEIEVEPDVVSIALAVVTENSGKNAAAETMEENSEAAWKVVAALKALGLQDDEITTSRVRLWARYSDHTKAKIAGFSAENRIVIRTKRLMEAGEFIGAAVEAGATRVESVDFSVSEAEEMWARAVEEAAAAAATEAAAVARGVGARLVRPLEVRVTRSGDAVQRRVEMANGARGRVPGRVAASYGVPAPVGGGQMRLMAHATVVYEIEPPRRASAN